MAIQVHMGYNFLRELLQFVVYKHLLYNYLCDSKGNTGCYYLFLDTQTQWVMRETGGQWYV